MADPVTTKRVRAVVLDVDGTLVDSNDAHTRAWVEALRSGGHEVPYDKVRRLIGMGSDNLLPGAVGVEKDTPEGKQLSEAWKAIFSKDYLPKIEAFPHTAELLQRMSDGGLRLAVASSAEKDMLDTLLERAGADGLIQELASSTDARNSKPDPDIIRAALDRLQEAPEHVLMIGDTPYDVEAAHRAGVGIIAFRCGGWDDAGLKGAIAIYDGPEDLLRNYETSPLASRE